jgi:hypothetical protein
MSDKTKKELLLEAQNEEIDVITTHRLAMLRSIDDLAAIGGKDDYQRSLLAVVTEFGADGIALNRVSEVFSDQPLLKAARKALEKANKIGEAGEGRSKMLKLVSELTPVVSE